MLPVSSLQVDTTQPRKFFEEEPMELLKDSVEEYGVLIPLFVRQISTRGGGQVYIILDGERRYRVSKALGLVELPCLILKNVSDLEVLEKQLMLDCLKEKLSSAERDSAIYQYWKMLGTLPKERLEEIKPPGTKSTTKDWTIYYISKHVGVSSYVVRMAVNKFDFMERHIDFHQKILEIIEGSGENKELLEKRYNAVLEETARKAEFRDNEEARKQVIENYIKDTDIDPRRLREGMDDMIKDGDMSEKTIDRKTEKSNDAKSLVTTYVERLAKITAELMGKMESNNIKKLAKTYEKLLTESLIETLAHLTGKEYELREKK